MVKAIQDIWQRANALFKPPVTNDLRIIHLKLKNLWQKAVSFSLGKGKLTDKERLDKLVDILSCKCSMIDCSEFNCEEECEVEVHIQCKCI